MNIIHPVSFPDSTPPLIAELAEASRILYNNDLNGFIVGPDSHILALKKDFKLRETRIRQNILLASDNRMGVIWTRLKKRHSEVSHYVDPYLEFFEAVQSALKETTPADSLAPKELDQVFNTLSASLIKISNQLKQLELTDSVFTYLTDSECEDLKIDIMGTDHDFSPEHHGLLVQYEIPDLLERYANQLKVRQETLTTLIKRPLRNKGGLLYFTRYMARYNLDTYGISMTDTISVMASIFFPSDKTSPDKIKASIKSMRP